MALEQPPEFSRRELFLYGLAAGLGVLALTSGQADASSEILAFQVDPNIERVNYLKFHHTNAWNLLQQYPAFIAQAKAVEKVGYEFLPAEYAGFNTEPIRVAMVIMTDELGLSRQTAAWWSGNFMGESADFKGHMHLPSGGKLAINPWSGFIGGGPKGIAQWQGGRTNNLPRPDRLADATVNTDDLTRELRRQLYFMFGEDLPKVVTGNAYDQSLDPDLTLNAFKRLAKDFEGYGAQGKRFVFADFIENHTYTVEDVILKPLGGQY